jgi:glycosyltransferase involved in cell wall biosynthesis
MKIIRVCQYYYSKENMESGLMPYFYFLVDELKKQGVEHLIITSESDSDEIEGTQVYKTPHHKRLSILKAGMDTYKKIEELVSLDDWDIIHTHNYGFFSLYHYRDKLKMPMVHSIHGSPFEYRFVPFFNTKSEFKDTVYTYLFNRYACMRADAVITVASEERERIIRGFGIDESRVFFAPTGVDTVLFKPIETEKDIDILYVGRFARKKSLPTLLYAVRRLKRDYQKIKVYFIGGTLSDFAYKEVIEAIERCGLSENVTILPPVKHVELLNYYNRSKIFVLPSLSEGLPKVVLEAMACALPVVATGVCGNKDAVIDGKTGFLIAPKKPEELAEKIKILLENKDLREKMGKSGRERVEKHFTWKNIAKKVLEIYGEILD